MRFLTAFLAIALLVTATGCPKDKRGLKAARMAVSLAAETVQQVDVSYTLLYEDASLEALAACEEQDCYVELMRRWDKGVRAVEGLKLSLLSVETSLDAWEAGASNAQFHEAALCFVASLQTLDALFDSLGVRLPQDFLQRAIDHALALFNINPQAGLALCGEGA